MRYRATGFTLIEMVVVIALIGIIAGIAIPNLQEYMRNSRLSTASEEMLVSLMLAKTESTMRGKATVACPASAVGCGDNWIGGWRVFVDDNNDGNLDSSETILRVSQAISGISSASGPANISFKPLLKAGTESAIEFCNVSSKKRIVTVKSFGSVQLTQSSSVASVCP